MADLAGLADGGRDAGKALANGVTRGKMQVGKAEAGGQHIVLRDSRKQIGSARGLVE